jgi:MoaA/NifB/PqqE/SkfB family radical SAM enzyme
MVRAMVELTYGCNLRCVHCYNPTHEAKNELSTDQICRILDGLAAQGCLWVGFTGGELFTRRDVFEIFRYAKSLGFVVSLLTNATLVTPERADQIKALAPYLVDISVYGATAETYERVTRVPGSFPKFVQGVDLLLERDVRIALKLVLMTLNAHEFEAMREFAVSRGALYKVGTEIFPRVDGCQEPLAYRLSPEQQFEIWRKISGKGILKRIRSSSGESASQQEEDRCGSAGQLFDCSCGKSAAAVTPHGKMNLCLSTATPQFDLTAGTVSEGWKELVDLVASVKPGPEYECGGCGLAKRCTRGTMDGWMEQGRFDGPCIPHFREVAQRKADFLEAGLK